MVYEGPKEIMAIMQDTVFIYNPNIWDYWLMYTYIIICYNDFNFIYKKR